MVGCGRGASAGILVRDAAAIEALATVDTVLVDKTGTLTEGKPRLVAIETTDGFDENAVLAQVAGLELASEHPLAAAIVEGARARGVSRAAPDDFEAIAGRGIRGSIGGRRLEIGSSSWLRELGVATTEFEDRVDAHRTEGRTVVVVAIDRQLAGLFAIADTLRPSSREAVAALRDEGLHVVMLTGDARGTAEAIARELGIEAVEAEVGPAQKGEVVARLRAAGHRVAMAGDGINDAVALATADVGIAMGKGSDIAIDSAGVTLVASDLRAITRARRLARATLRNIRQNLAFAFVYNLIGVPIAAGALYPLTGLLLSPMFASAAMSLSSVSVIANALRLRRTAL